MKNYTEFIIDYSEGNLSDRKHKWFEAELMSNKELNENYKLFKQVNELMRGRLDLEEVQNDPDRKSIDTLTNLMIAEFRLNPIKFKNNRAFVESSLKENDSLLQKELDDIKLEAQKYNINEVTKSWVNDWDSSNQIRNLGTENRRAFISSAMSNENRSESGRRSSRSKSYPLRIAGFAAAAMIAKSSTRHTTNR